MISSLLPLPMGEVPLERAERACLPSQSLRDSSPKVGAKGGNGGTDCDRRGTHHCEHWCAMTDCIRNRSENRWILSSHSRFHQLKAWAAPIASTILAARAQAAANSGHCAKAPAHRAAANS